MPRFWTLLIVGVIVHANDNDKIGNIFSDSTNEVDSDCSGIKGHLSNGCYECYVCGDERLNNYGGAFKELIITDRSCVTTKVCCYPQERLVAKDGGDCGVNTPNGLKNLWGKTQNRTHIRSVLQGEYPWRAWVYRKGSSKELLCAGTIVDTYAEVLLTSASCVHNYPANMLAVTFRQQFHEEIDVDYVVVHEDYKANKPNINDIALLMLNKKSRKAPGWVSSVCLTSYPAMHATTCVVTTDKDYYVNSVIPLPKYCEIDNKRLHISQICATAPKDDYVPQAGAGLFCQDKLHTATSNFYIYGIALQNHNSMTIYTNVSHFQSWIDGKISSRSSRYED